MKTYQLTAHYVSNSLNLAEIEQNNRSAPLLRRERNLLLFKLSDNKFVGVFSFGVVAVIGSESQVETERLVAAFGSKSEEKVEPERYGVIIDPAGQETVDFENINLQDLDPEKIILCFWTAAQSVTIDHLERKVDEALFRFERVHHGLAERGKLTMGSREALRTIGMGGNAVNFIIGKLSLLDKPDITWEEESAARLHASLRKQFELDDRFNALQFKLGFLQDSSETVLEVLQHRKSAMLEVIVIVLIAMEFLFFIYAEFV